MPEDICLQIWVSPEEHLKLMAQKTTKRSWRQFLLEPLLNK